MNHANPLIALSELKAKIYDVIQAQYPAPESQLVPLQHSLKHVLADDITAPLNLPRFNISAMDGYAIPCIEDVLLSNSTYTIIGESSAGSSYSGSCSEKECIRIMTGATVPTHCHTVVMQENVSRDGNTITLLQDTPVNKNIRKQGEEIEKDSQILASGTILSPADILLLSSLGIADVRVNNTVTIGLLSTGDELKNSDEPLTDDAIYDSNRPALTSLLSSLAVTIKDYGIIADDLELIKGTLNKAAQECDVIITSGGVSVGDYDYLRQAVEELGNIGHYKVAMKPGKPFVFGDIQNTLYFGLPGNPISTFIGFEQIVKPALWQLNGAHPVPQAITLKAKLTCALKKRKGRADFQRGYISQQEDGRWQVAKVGAQDSHRVKGLSLANALILLKADDGDQQEGDIIDVQPLPWAFL